MYLSVIMELPPQTLSLLIHNLTNVSVVDCPLLIEGYKLIISALMNTAFKV